MRKLQTPWILCLTTLVLAVLVRTPRIVHAASPAQTQPGEIIRLLVKVDPATHSDAQIPILATLAGDDNSLTKLGWEIIEVHAATAPEVIAELQATEGVVDVTPDYPLELAWNPNDPGYTRGNQWALDKIGADIAWEFSLGQAITVAVIDSGIDGTHPDLADRIVPGYNFMDMNTDTTGLCGHGTHVAGILAAETNNSIGVAGVAPEVIIMPIKVLGDDCLGSYSRLMQGILYAVDHGVRIISIASGGRFEHAGLHDAIIYAHSKGVLVAVSSGNRGDALPFYPGSFEESFTVAGTDEADKQYTRSNFGQQIDMSAPATTIYSTYFDKEKGSTYAYMTGTSMAVPHVTAVAALILAIDPNLPLANLEDTLIKSATDLGEAGWDPIFGWGRVTAWRAAAMVSPAAGNVRVGHFRVPNMDAFPGSNITATSGVGTIELSWTQELVAADQTVVVYRSIVPVFDGATDIGEVEATPKGTFSDTEVEVDHDHYYWLVQADNDIELAITKMISTTARTAPEPTQPVPLFMPMLQR